MFRYLCAAVPFLAVSCVSNFEKNQEPTDTDIVEDTDTDTDIVDDAIPQECLDAVPCVEEETIYVGNVEGLQELMQCSEVRNLELIGVEGLERLELPCLRKANIIFLWNGPLPDLVSISLPQLRAGYDDNVPFALVAWDQPKLERIEAMPLLREARLWFDNNPLLHDIDGFSAVSKFGLVRLQNNPSLAQTTAFSNAEEIGPYLEVRETPVELDFLDALMPVMDGITLNDTSIESLDFLNDIESVGSLGISHNAGLSDFSGLSNIAFHEINNGDGTFSSPSLGISNQPQLSELTLSAEKLDLSLRDLPNLSNLTLSAAEMGGLNIFNTGLQELFLPNVAVMGGIYNGLNIEDNPALESIVLPSLLEVKDRRISIHNNTALRVFNASSLMHIGDGIEISNNPLLQQLELSNVTVLSFLYLHTNTALQAIQLPNVTSLNHFEYRLGEDGDTDFSPVLQQLELPNLSEIDYFSLTQSALQELSLPSLTAVNGWFEVYDNPQLCQEQVQAIADSVGVTCDCTNNQSCE